METKLYNTKGEEIGKIELPEKVFGAKVNVSLLWETTTIILRNQRKGTAKTKTRAEVRGGGRKPWRQKGIGWARHGSIRSPIWVKGGVVFGPKPRDYYTTMPKWKKNLALVSALSAIAKENRVLIIEDIKFEKPKTREFVEILKKINLSKEKVLLSAPDFGKNLKLAVRNLPNVQIKRSNDINSYDILSTNFLLLTKSGLEELKKRCGTNR